VSALSQNKKPQKATRHTALDAVSVPSRQDFKQELQFKNVAKTGQIPNRVRNDDMLFYFFLNWRFRLK